MFSALPLNNVKHTDRLSRWVHFILLIGVTLSALVLSIGLFLVLCYRVPRPEVEAVPIVPVLKAAVRGDSVAILYTGLLLLMLTPVARVAVLVLGWWLDGDRRFALVALCVLLLLFASLWMGAS